MSYSLTTHSKFYYGHTIDSANYLLDFKEGAPELTAEVKIGTYSITEFGEEVKRALDAAGDLTYTVGLNRTTRKFTISSTVNFELRVLNGTHLGTSVFTLLGFTTNRSGASTYLADLPSGSEYKTQFKIQDYIPSANWQGAIEASVNKTASGRVEVIRFGIEKFIQANFRLITNLTQANDLVRNDSSGLEKILDFLGYMIQKGPFEFMPNENSTSVYEKVILESTPDSPNGTAYKLKELYGLGLPGYYETGLLKMRVIE